MNNMMKFGLAGGIVIAVLSTVAGQIFPAVLFAFIAGLITVYMLGKEWVQK